MASHLMSGFCTSCRGYDLFLEYDYKRYDFSHECKHCGFFREAIVFGIIDASEMTDIGFKEVNKRFYDALKMWGLLPVFIRNGHAALLNRFRRIDTVWTFHAREGYIKKTSENFNRFVGIKRGIYDPPFDLNDLEVEWI